jgi:hypothetical protein
MFASLFSPTETPTPEMTGSPTSSPVPDLTATYDANAAQFAAWLATYEATTGVTPTPSPTSGPTATAAAVCKLDMAVTSDPEVEQDLLTPGQEFTKRWVIENTGTCPWPEDVELVFASGTDPEIVDRPRIEPLAPGETTEIELVMLAPTASDIYISVWQLQDGMENLIGDILEVTYRVGPTPTPTATATPAATPTPEFTPTPPEPLWMSDTYLTWCNSARTEGGVGWSVGGGPSAEYRYFYSWVIAENELPRPENDFPVFPHVETYFTTSGPLTFPVPDDCCPGDYGQYVSPEGYEIVWKKVWLTVDSCP